jgi:WD40 repeat protein
LSWSEDNTLRLWSEDGVSLAVLEGHAGVVNGALELADGRLLSWSDDKNVRLWSEDGVPLTVLEGRAGTVDGVVTLADGRLISRSRNTFQLWSREGTPLTTLKGHAGRVGGPLELADGRLLSWSDDGTVRLWSSNGAPLDLWGTPMGPIRSVVPSAADERTFAVLINRYVYMIEIERS